ncbi:MAG: uroporphyrinogen-III synthase [Acidobacteriota bacterium]
MQKKVSTPLKGRRVVVTRPREQAAGLAEALRAHGAEVIEAPAIQIEAALDAAPLDAAIQGLESYDWIVFTSVNGVRAFLTRLEAQGRRAEELGACHLAAIGPATAAALRERGLSVDVVPRRFVAEQVFEAIRTWGPLTGKRILLPRADIAREALPELLRGHGAEVDVVVAYQTVPASGPIAEALELISRGMVDVVTFTSGSTVRSFFAAAEDKGRLRDRFLPASIGPITSQALREEGFEPRIEARVFTTGGLVEALVEYFRSPSTEEEPGERHPGASEMP